MNTDETRIRKIREQIAKNRLKNSTLLAHIYLFYPCIVSSLIRVSSVAKSCSESVMEAQPAVVTVRFNKFLPYWAVLQTDLKQTLRSWVYRLWVLMTVVAAAGFLIYRVGLHKEAGMFQSAATQSGDLFRFMIIGSLALVVVLAVSAVGAEKGTVADSVLSRGISRHQYFLAKWHARLAVVVSTFAVLSIAILAASYFLFKSDADSDLSLLGGLMAILTVSAVLVAIVS